MMENQIRAPLLCQLTLAQAYYTDTENFQKVSFGDVESAPFTLNANNGWIGIIQRYFASSWIISSKAKREFFSKEVTSILMPLV
jgi:YidC/Oxa1 family membrane protein insertase